MQIESASSAPIDTDRVRRLFARPQRVAGADFLRREVAARMHERLALIKLEPQRMLDAGCGAGFDLPELRARYAGAELLGVDLAPAMLAQARTQVPPPAAGLSRLMARLWPARAEAALVCGDFAQLPLAPNSLDLIWSNLALHWHAQPDRVFAEWRRVLRVQGLLMFSCFGPDTLKEVRTAFAGAGLPAPVLPFVDMHDFGDMLVGAGFATPVMDMETVTVTYSSVDKLLAEVRALGGNPLATCARGLQGRRSWQAVRAGLERMRRSDATIALTFEVIYGHAFRPVARTTASGEAIVRLDFPKKKN